MVLASSSKPANTLIFFCVLAGKKPSKVKRSVGIPAAESAQIIAEAPGKGTTLMLFWRRYLTKM